ncbi:hypothetical protein [Croceicoccus sp. Ery15]|uniref:hypothetical protein n=1 Tax=Croceicoccus sp. Ery15 TaxID=1703338 RepID=UPI001E2E91B5|nr:hypothetical protein [Croceicoccus sp. Ery15]
MRAAACIALLALCACSAEPDFDERFEKADAETRQLAQEIDGQLEASPVEPVGDAEAAQSGRGLR